MADNYNNEILGDGSFFWWTGRVADDDNWRENQLDKLVQILLAQDGDKELK